MPDIELAALVSETLVQNPSDYDLRNMIRLLLEDRNSRRREIERQIVDIINTLNIRPQKIMVNGVKRDRRDLALELLARMRTANTSETMVADTPHPGESHN